MNYARECHSMHYDESNRILYVLGGCDNSMSLDSIEICDFNTLNHNSHKLSININEHSINEKPINKIDLHWTLLEISMPLCLYSFSTFSFNNELYIVGGKQANKDKNNDLYKLNLNNKIFEKIINLNDNGESVKENVFIDKSACMV